jgi:hypothetical protein
VQEHGQEPLILQENSFLDKMALLDDSVDEIDCLWTVAGASKVEVESAFFVVKLIPVDFDIVLE